jgi:hypothetical protein
MLWTIYMVVLLLWLLVFSLHVARGLIHLMLFVAFGHPDLQLGDRTPLAADAAKNVALVARD